LPLMELQGTIVSKAFVVDKSAVCVSKSASIAINIIHRIRTRRVERVEDRITHALEMEA
jgi:hypothetical protein